MLSIQQTTEGYTAQVTPLNSAEPWETPAPMTREKLRRKLLDLGCHPVDVADQLAFSDPNWEPEVPAAHWPETARRRRQSMSSAEPETDERGPSQS